MNELNIHRLECALSEILSRKHNAKVTIKFIERDGQNGSPGHIKGERGVNVINASYTS